MINSRAKYIKLVEWAKSRYNPKRGDKSLNTRSYNAIIIAAEHKYKAEW